MAQATVLSVTGNAVVVQADGTTRALKVGDVIQKGETIRTAAGARVELMMEDGQVVAMGPAQALRVDETMAQTEATPDAQAAAAQGTTVDQITQVLEAGGDLTEELEAAAAGGGAGGGGDGSDFVRLLRIVEPVDPLAYDYNYSPLGPVQEIQFSVDGQPDPLVVTLGSSQIGIPESALTLDRESDPAVPGSLPFTTNKPEETQIRIQWSDNDDADDWFEITLDGAITTVETAYGYLNVWYENGELRFEFVLERNASHPNPEDSSLDGNFADDFISENFVIQVLSNGTVIASSGIQVDILDDGPVADVDAVAEVESLVLDESDEDEGDGVRSETADFKGYFVEPQFGADGFGSVSYALVLTGTAVGSGLYAVDAAAEDGKGDEILLYQNDDGVIEGKLGDQVYFTLSVDNDPESDTFGHVTFTQTVAEGVSIWHSDVGDHDDFESLVVDAGDGEVLNSLQLVQTVTDGDGDTDTAALDLGNGVFRIEDDGPVADVDAVAEIESLVLDESDEDEGDGVRSETADFTGYFAEPKFGADGFGSVSYALVLTGTAVGSGLYAVDAAAEDGKGDEILLYQKSGVIEGRVGGADGQIYFTLSVDNDPESDTFGHVTFTQTVAEGVSIWHSDVGDHDDFESLVVDAGDGEVLNSLQLVQTVTDGDGDTDTAALDLGNGVFRIEDDGPTLLNVDNSLFVPITELSGQTYSGAFAVNPGADGLAGFVLTGVPQDGVNFYRYDYQTQDVQIDLDDYPDLGDGEALLVARFDDGADYYYVIVRADGTYDVTFVNPPQPEPVNADLTTIPPGNFKYVWFDADALNPETTNNEWSGDKGSIKNNFAESEAEIRISSSGTINTSNAGIGVSNQHFEVNESLTFDFSKEAQRFSISTVRDAGSGGTLVVQWEAKLDGAVVASGYVAVTGGNQELVFDPAGSVAFDSITITGMPPLVGGYPIDGADQNLNTTSGAKFTLASVTLLYGFEAEDYSTAFTIQAVDGDGDLTPEQTITVNIEGDSLITNVLTLEGADGDDVIYGSSDNDILIGGEGNDILIGGAGDDILTGGGGADVFRWSLADEGSDTVTDFSFEEGDALDLSDLITAADENDLKNYFEITENNDGDLVVKFAVNGDGDFSSASHTITLQNITLTDLDTVDLAAQLTKLQGGEI